MLFGLKMQWSIHCILDEFISKANEPLCFEVLVQKLLPNEDITQHMQEKETDCLLSH